MASRRHFGTVRKLPSGRWQASYWHDGTRHTASRTFPAKADALAWLAAVETSVHRGEWVDPAAGRETVVSLAERWLAANPAKRASSRARDEVVVRMHMIPTLGPRAVSAVTRADIQSLVDTWTVTHSASTVSRHYSTLRAMFAYAVLSDMIAKTPCSSIRLPRVELVERPQPVAEDLDRLATALGPDDAVFAWLGVVAGLRWAEVAGLTVGSLDLLHGAIQVRQQLGRDGTLGVPKSQAGSRRISIPGWLVDDLAALLGRRGLSAADGDILVFTSPEGGPLRYTNWRRRTWVPACAMARMTGLRFHDLRSMAATALFAAGVDVKTAQTRMGHSSPQVTLRIYARATGAADRAAADAVGAFFSPARTQRARQVSGPPA